MDLKTQLTEDLKSALKSGDVIRKDTIRALKSAIKNAEIDSGEALSDEGILGVLIKQAKQRKDSIEQFNQANRFDLSEQEEKELAVIETYLPKQLSDDEITARAKGVIETLGVDSMRGMGQVMQQLSKDLTGIADGKRISRIVRGLLS